MYRLARSTARYLLVHQKNEKRRRTHTGEERRRSRRLIALSADERDEVGYRLVTRNDDRIDEETGERCRSRSDIVPLWRHKSPKVMDVLPPAVPARNELAGLVPVLDVDLQPECAAPPSCGGIGER